MTVESEEGYEIAKQYLKKKYAEDYVDFIATEGQAYLDGLAEGRKEKAEEPTKSHRESICKGCEFENVSCDFYDENAISCHWWRSKKED